MQPIKYYWLAAVCYWCDGGTVVALDEAIILIG
jgi:hypothetical protein